jgi:hypothetical protein
MAPIEFYRTLFQVDIALLVLLVLTAGLIRLQSIPLATETVVVMQLTAIVLVGTLVLLVVAIRRGREEPKTVE